jgi:hypothetical protein
MIVNNPKNSITHVHGSNARNHFVQISLSQTSKYAISFLLSLYVFSSTKSENKRMEQVLPGWRGSGGGWGRGKWHK